MNTTTPGPDPMVAGDCIGAASIATCRLNPDPQVLFLEVREKETWGQSRIGILESGFGIPEATHSRFLCFYFSLAAARQFQIHIQHKTLVANKTNCNSIYGFTLTVKSVGNP